MSEKVVVDSQSVLGEKGQIEEVRSAPSPDSAETAGPRFDKARTAQLLRKLDVNLVPFLALLYLWVVLTLSIGSVLTNFST